MGGGDVSFERVEEVLLATTELQYASTIADRAAVSDPGARKQLRTLADAGFAEAEPTGHATRFNPLYEFDPDARDRDVAAVHDGSSTAAGREEKVGSPSARRMGDDEIRSAFRPTS